MAFQRNWDCESGHILHETGKLTITLICIVNIYIFSFLDTLPQNRKPPQTVDCWFFSSP